MSKYAIDEVTLQGIADAIRAKTGKNNLIDGSEMASEIENIPTISQEALTITGNCSYRFNNDGFTWFINSFGPQVTTTDISDCSYMFTGCKGRDLKTIPFLINCTPDVGISITEMFADCWYLETVPKITNCRPLGTTKMFYKCSRLKELPEDIAEWFDWSYIESNSSAYRQSMFTSCSSLRRIPRSFLDHNCPSAAPQSSYLRDSFQGCKTLEELTDLPIPFTSKVTASIFTSTSFQNCGRLKNVTFALDPSTNAPYVKQWSSQLLCLDIVGSNSRVSDFYESQNSSGITLDKRVTDSATYQALKNDPDWWTTDPAYSRYNHDSAVATINSLPDTSAFIAAGNTANVVQFLGVGGSSTDGGAINTLTDSEIAVATAKGWTVSFV